MLFGLAFLGIKGIEWTSKFEEHHIPGACISSSREPFPDHPGQPVDQQHAQIFFSLYFAMTGMHALHMVIGVGIFSWLLYHGMEGPLHAGISHASRKLGLILALRRHCLDLSVSVALLDRP